MKNDDDFAKPGSGQTEGGRLISRPRKVRKHAEGGREIDLTKKKR
jgi:hypothetical protein